MVNENLKCYKDSNNIKEEYILNIKNNFNFLTFNITYKLENIDLNNLTNEEINTYFKTLYDEYNVENINISDNEVLIEIKFDKTSFSTLLDVNEKELDNLTKSDIKQLKEKLIEKNYICE